MVGVAEIQLGEDLSLLENLEGSGHQRATGSDSLHCDIQVPIVNAEAEASILAE